MKTYIEIILLEYIFSLIFTSFLAAYFAKQNTKFGSGGKRGQAKIPSPQLLPFCPLERLDFKIRNSDFRQKMFELRSKNTTKFFIQ